MWDDIPSGGGNNGESVLAWSAHRRGYREHRRPSEENIWMGLTLQPPKHSERREIKRLSKRLGMAEIAYDSIKGKHIYISPWVVEPLSYIILCRPAGGCSIIFVVYLNPSAPKQTLE